MIYTVTFNPSLDYIVKMESFQVGEVNRTVSEKIFPGGKGINVSIVLQNLGINNVALGFIAGFTGEQIEQEVKAFGCKTDFIRIPNSISRINVKLKADRESEINGQGPLISKSDLQKMFDKMDSLADGDLLVLAGSIPNTLPESIYETILKRIQGKNIKVVVDATRELLFNVLKFHPFLIKPNHHELGEIFNKKLESKEEVIYYAKELQKSGARNVLVSMAGSGAVLVDENSRVYQSPAPKGVVRNSVGAGDSMVAGFIAGYLPHESYPEAFRMGVASGSASAFCEELATKAEIGALLNSI